MPKIRVGFVLGQVSWIGGINYFRNIFSAVNSLEDASLEIVVFSGIQSDVSAFEGLAKIVRTPVLDRRSPSWFVRKIIGKVIPTWDPILSKLLHSNGIDVVFHFGTHWSAGIGIPATGWIPDFQHLHYPGFFNKKEYRDRDDQFSNIVAECDSLVFSSKDSLADMMRRYVGCSKPTYVLPFVSSLCPDLESMAGVDELRQRYGLGKTWFHIANQFWAHKNHGVVIEALHELKLQGIEPTLVMTGKTDDYRNLEYFPKLMEKVDKYGLSSQFRALGVIPYPDVVALMFHSMAVINPSLFEGWNTSVEEAKALGKTVVLSDIAVHREQSPERAFYFEPHDQSRLADALKAIIEIYSKDEEGRAFSHAAATLPARRAAFARQFEVICIETANRI